MSAFIFENRRVICKLLTYRYIHIFYVFVLRNIGFSAVPLIDSLGYSHISFYVSIMVLLLTPISIFFAYAMLGLGFSPAQCAAYFVGGVIDAQWLQECLKSVGIYTDKGATNDNSSGK